MSETGIRRNSTAGEKSTLPKRRKVRKGTQSCWECKRRKVRCTFAAPTQAVCDGCRSRRTKCIGQEYTDETALVSRQVDRLSRMEAIVEQLLNRSNSGMSDELRQDRLDEDENVELVPDPDLEGQVTGSLDELSCALLAVWPNQDDLNLILSVPVSVAVLLHGVVCMPYSRFFSRQIASPQRMLQLPPKGSHPVLIARRLLLLGTLLQGIPPCFAEKLVGMRSDYRTIMSSVVNAASRLVTSNDELVGSLDGIECIMIEGMYLNNAGNLRRAWLTNRRAMVMAQMMGLHTGASSASMTLEAETRDRIDPDYMWFRLVCSDRYLSLMLGLPQGSLENVFASPKALDGCIALERMERIEVMAGGLILQRNSTERTDLAATYRVDKMLQEAAALMPPQWWLMTPDLTAIASNDAKAFEETIRLTNQFAHHHLLVQLHLPYMMLPSSADASYDYSKMTAANASRAIVTKFVSFRNSILATAYCRGIDFITFIASTTLCLSHIEAHRQYKCNRGKGVGVFQPLQHQRLSDRGLLERTLELMETMAQREHDVPLLAIENNSAKGAYYHTSASSEFDNQEPQRLGKTGQDFDILYIQIPYFGTIKIERRPAISHTAKSAQTLSEEWLWNASDSHATDASLVVLCDPPSRADREQHKEQQEEMTSATCPLGYEISITQPANADWQVVPSYVDSPDTLPQFGSANWDQSLSSFDTSGAQEAHLLVPGLAAGPQDWALQGVEMALFNNLTQGSVDSTETRSLRTYMQ
ncbi:hypothetical protein B0O99DRAFT_654633 [Bisporella sp. PMI_857]|nr:hypothetical protein B0O99DRAFT_654633 [Bisporella sp. PMI_857]